MLLLNLYLLLQPDDGFTNLKHLVVG